MSPMGPQAPERSGVKIPVRLILEIVVKWFKKARFDMKRKPMNRQRGAAEFRREIKRTKAVNVAPGPMRGGIRL